MIVVAASRHASLMRSARWLALTAGLMALICSPTLIHSSAFYDRQAQASPRFKQILFARSPDCSQWQVDPHAVAGRGTSSDHIYQGGELLLLHWSDVPPEGIVLRRPGRDDAPVAVLPEDCHGADVHCVDPNLVRLGDGRLRLYYAALPEPEDPGRPNEIRSALSSDGLRWQREPGVRLRGPIMDPDVAPTREGGFRMYYTHYDPWAREGSPERAIYIGSARSSDGLDFVQEPGQRLEAGNASASVLLPDDRVRTWYHTRESFRQGPGADAQAYVRSAVSRDGLHFEDEGPQLRLPYPTWSRRLGAEAPAVERAEDGSCTMTFTTVVEPLFPFNLLETGVL